MKLIIAEKPSVGKDIAKVLGANHLNDGYTEGNGYICTWAFGHLITLYDCEDYKKEWKSWKNIPVIPEEFKIKSSNKKGIKEQLEIISKLMNRHDVTSIVCATDAGREGELIFRHIYNYLNCQKPIERLWINSLTDEDIKKGFQKLENGDLDKYLNLYDCAFAREKADWLVGMNLTRCFSNIYCKYGDKPLSIGRVQTPTLKLIVDRENDIKNFRKNHYYKVQISYNDIVAVYDEKFENRDNAELIAEEVDGTSSIITSLKKEIKKNKAPLLFDITSLQKECNKRFSMSAQQTLDTAQSLYEKKLITYPRTDSKFLNASMKDEAEELANRICKMKNYSININVAAIIDDSKVTDHHAIIPTRKIFNDFSISDQEQKVLELIILRYITSVAPDMKFEHLSAVIKVKNYDFKASANRTLDLGWTGIDKDGTSSIEKESKNMNLFNYKVNDVFSPVHSQVTSHETKPKQRYTEETILSAMENAGIKDFKNIDGVERVGLGTGATRAAIIEVLLNRGYIERKKRTLIPTERGIHLIDVVPDSVCDVSMTIEWEKQIAEIKKGNLKADVFVKNIEDYICSTVNKYYTPSVSSNIAEGTGNICPDCGSPLVMRHGKYGDFEACSNYPKCKYVSKKEKKITYSSDKCPLCKGRLVKRNSQFGSFLGCENYPKCKYIKKDSKK